MKLLCTAVILFVAGLVGVAALFCPFCAFPSVEAYYDNAPLYKITGLCYSADATVRAELDGGEEDLISYFKSIEAREVGRESCGGGIIVYAYSPRVCKVAVRPNGDRYNVMASISERGIVIGAPVLSGSY